MEYCGNGRKGSQQKPTDLDKSFTDDRGIAWDRGQLRVGKSVDRDPCGEGSRREAKRLSEERTGAC